VTEDLNIRMVEFLHSVTTTMGLSADVSIEPIADGTRIVISGEDCEVLVRRQAVGLDAIQHIVNAVFRREHPKRHIVVDSLDYRKTKDAELRETAKILLQLALELGKPQEIGPLNPYARRIVHLVIAEDPRMSSKSIGDDFLKIVVITAEG
jgi:spoIIIJ-associated protein